VTAFTHLHVHSHYSLLAATPPVTALAAHAAAGGFTSLALTDNDALYGAVAFADACRAQQIRPILGMSVPVAAPEEGLFPTEAVGRLLFLALGPAGYRSLCRLSYLLQAGPQREQRLAQGLGWQELKSHSEGLICLSGGRAGWLERAVRDGDLQAAGRYVSRLGGIYGDDAYLSLEMHRPEDQAAAREVAALGRRFGLGLVAAQPVYCLSPADAPRLRLLAAIRRNCLLASVPAAALPDDGDAEVDVHWLSEAEVAARFADFPEALANVAEISRRCGPALPGGTAVWPALDLPEHESPAAALAAAAGAGLALKYGPVVAPAVAERLQKELAAIGEHGYAPLFLIVADIVRFARQAGIPVSSRGSVANCLVAYCLQITTVDPIEHDLLFERFLNPARANPPDIDLDFCSRRRDEVLAYVRRRYGEEQVALVGTMNTLQLRSAIRETAKAHGLPEHEAADLIRRLPRRWHPDPRRRDGKTLADVLKGIEGEERREIVRQAFALVNQPDHLSVHPGGVVITPGPLTTYVPVQWAPKGFLITQFEHHGVEAVGLPKLDLLGIRALTVLADTAEWVRHFHDPHFHLEQIPPDDEQTGAMLAQGDTIGVFQCESAGAQRTLRQLQARTVQDLAVANAFFKPGPAMGGMVRHFIRRYRGEEAVTLLHPALAPILGATQGVLLFQEQILRLATEIAGLSWEQADHLRRGMSKFKAAEMAAMRAQFVAGCRRPLPEGPAFTSEQAETLWEQIIPFAGYGFNRGHATAYADVSYRSAYLKAHWPAEFLCARLAGHGGFHHPAIYMAEATRMGIEIRPPHVNRSRGSFTLTYENEKSPVIWLGLGQVRDLRRDRVAAIIAERGQRPFSGLSDLLERVPLQVKEIVHLIQCGGLDGMAESRAALLAEAQSIRRSGSSRQMAFAFAAAPVRPETAAERLAWEQRLLGRPVTVSPLSLVAEQLPATQPLARLAHRPGRQVTVAGMRLPGWPGGEGFFLSDDHTFVLVKGVPSPPAWQPLLLHGRWQVDEWDSGWFQADDLRRP
jgi:DNA polymerase III subunit alpha